MRNSATARLVVMGGLAIVLLIPLTWVWTLVSERASRRNDAVAEVSDTWGHAQTFGGVVLSVPYVTAWTDASGHPQKTAGRAHFLPRDLKIAATLKTESRKRGIFGVIVYHTEVKMTGRFSRPDLSWVRSAPETIEWGNATVSVGVTDPRALTRRISLDIAGQTVPFTGGAADVGLFQTGIHARIPKPEILQQNDIPFALTLEANGTRDIWFLPSADETSVELAAAWPHPSFSGSPLPDYRENGDGTFTARWHAPDFGRPYAARWTGADMNREQLLKQAEAAAFGVSLIQPVDIYHQAERAVKYAVLFIVLTFLVFFLWEILHTVLLHPMQYAFVGFALFLFYLLLVSISEHTGFDKAYLTSATVTTLVVAGYARAVLRGSKQGLSVLVSLSSLYGFLYLLLRLEDYALLAGSAGLFVILAGVMYVTRRMDWYALRLGTKAPDVQ
jgi:inner membrane protein